jgi:ADP-heptose:LPS heptosyltransferase
MTYFIIILISALLKVQNAILQILQKIIWLSPPSSIKNIIIYKNGNIGDIITAYPAIKLIKLKYPQAKIVLLTSPGSKDLISAASILKSQNLVNKILYYYDGKIFPLFNTIRQKKFDLCFMMSDDRSTFSRELRNLFFFSFLNIKYLDGFSVNRIKFAENSFSQKIPYPYVNEVRRNINTTRINGDENNLFQYNHNDISDIIYDNVQILHNALIVATGAKLESKKWNDDNFFEIAKLWIRNKGDIVFIGNKNDGINADNIISRLNNWKMRTDLMFKTNNCYNFCNKTTLNETIFVISKGVAMIANDSGPGHLSSFTNTKVVTIQAPQDFKIKWDPYFSKELVLRPNRKHICSCSIDSCGYCINDITHNDAWEKLKVFA